MIPGGAAAQARVPKGDETARFGNPTGTGRQLQDLFYGVVKSVDKKEIVLEKTKFGIDQAIVLTEKTKFVHDGKTSKFEDLKKGDQVWIRIKTKKKTGEMIAKVVISGVIAPTVRK
jgi:hypothetical protein